MISSMKLSFKKFDNVYCIHDHESKGIGDQLQKSVRQCPIKELMHHPLRVMMTLPLLPSAVSLHDSLLNPPAPPHDSWNANWDGLEGLAPSPSLKDAASGRPLLVTRHLIFIRHGQYV